MIASQTRTCPATSSLTFEVATILLPVILALPLYQFQLYTADPSACLQPSMHFSLSTM